MEEMVRQGRITVNTKLITELPFMIDPAQDVVRVDDERVAFPKANREPIYILLNKPKDVFSTNVAQGEQTLAIDLLPPNLGRRVFPVGRLDAQTKGLLLLTDDGELTQLLTHPRYGIPKTYRALVDGYVTPETLAALEKGIWLSDPQGGKGYKTSGHFHLTKRSRDKSILEVVLREGRNRQVRRMLAQVGHKVRDLTRIRIGPLTIRGLNPGESRLLTPREVRQLREMATKKAEPAKKPRRP